MTRRVTTLILLTLAVTFTFAAGTSLAAEPPRSVLDLSYNTDEIGPSDVASNSLDLYLPARPDDGAGLRPLVVWVHGGGFMAGDKSNRMPDKVKLFNDLGYIVASINYRLSPDISVNCCDFDPGRVRAPDHIADVAEAIGWLSRNIRDYGGDPDAIVLIGHSAGAQLVSLAGTSTAWIKGRWVSPKQILGVVSLDTDTFNVGEEAADTSPLQERMLAWNAFGTPTEEAAEARWDRMSPALFADPSDPPFLFVTQATKPGRIAANQAMATKLGEDPAAAVVAVPYDHEGINTALGAADDSSVETARVSQFVQEAIVSAEAPGVRITRRPAKRVTVRLKGKPARKVTRKVTFAFEGTGRARGFQCRIDGTGFAPCRSPKNYRLKPGSHTFRVRPLYPSGRPGEIRKVTFRIIARRIRR